MNTKGDRMSKRKEKRARMCSLLLFIPNLLRLLLGLLRDSRVSSADKAILAGTIIYVISPIDIIPDFIPFIGQIDDIYLIAIALLRLLNRADGEAVRDHWQGRENIKGLVENIAGIAEYFLPRRVKNVLR